MWTLVLALCTLPPLIAIAVQLRGMRRDAQSFERVAAERHDAWMAQLEALGYALGLATHVEPRPMDRPTPLDTGPIAPAPEPFIPPPPPVPSLRESAPPVALSVSLPAPPLEPTAERVSPDEDILETAIFRRHAVAEVSSSPNRR
jgi:hypothetical protein